MMNKPEKKGGCGCDATVLVVEDNYYNVLPLKMLLKSNYKLNIERAENGKLGVDAYERNATKTCCQTNFKLIFMDLNMPVMDGFQSCSNILKMF